MVDLIDDLKTIEKSKRVQRDQQAGYRELFRHSQIWERQAAIACRGRSVCFIPSYSISAGAHKRTKNPKLSGDCGRVTRSITSSRSPEMLLLAPSGTSDSQPPVCSLSIR